MVCAWRNDDNDNGEIIDFVVRRADRDAATLASFSSSSSSALEMPARHCSGAQVTSAHEQLRLRQLSPTARPPVCLLQAAQWTSGRPLRGSKQRQGTVGTTIITDGPLLSWSCSCGCSGGGGADGPIPHYSQSPRATCCRQPAALFPVNTNSLSADQSAPGRANKSGRAGGRAN